MIKLLLSACILISTNATIVAGILHENQGQYVHRCVNALLNGNYAGSLRIADSVLSADTCDAMAPILKLTTIGIRNVDFDTLLDSALFFLTYTDAEKRIARYEAAHGSSSYSTMLNAFCKSLHASFHLEQRSYFAAMQNGFAALDLSKTAWTKDSTNADALFFLGLYDYGRGEIKKALWWVMFWYPGSKELGIKRLLACYSHGTITRDAALFVLADIYIRENNLDRCKPFLDQLTRTYPKSRFVLWTKSKYFKSKRNFYEAALTCELLALSYEAIPEGTYNALVTRALQAEMLLKAGQKKDARKICMLVLDKATDKRGMSVKKTVKKILEHIDEP